MNKTNSERIDWTCDVPQGSILRPLLFLIFVNDLQVSVDPDCQVGLDADDTAIFVHIKIQNYRLESYHSIFKIM